MKKTTKHSAEVLKEIKAELKSDVIRCYEMPTICNMNTCEDSGFSVILTLNTKYDYSNVLFDVWMRRLEASYYIITVKRNQLRVSFYVLTSNNNQ